MSKTTQQLMNLNTSYSIEDEKEKQRIISNNPLWYSQDEVDKVKSILIKLIDNMKERGKYMDTYTLIEYAQVRVNIDTAFKSLRS
jgi:hypothetical protein